jgi:hypothetical protein
LDLKGWVRATEGAAKMKYIWEGGGKNIFFGMQRER